jgi:hypothetical protein
MDSYRRLISWVFASRSEGAQYVIFVLCGHLPGVLAQVTVLYLPDKIISCDVRAPETIRQQAERLPDFSGCAGWAIIRFSHKPNNPNNPGNKQQQRKLSVSCTVTHIID